MNKKSNMFHDMHLLILYTILTIILFMSVFHSPFTIEMLANTFPKTECENCIIWLYVIHVLGISILVHLSIEICKMFKKAIKHYKKDKKYNLFKRKNHERRINKLEKQLNKLEKKIKRI